MPLRSILAVVVLAILPAAGAAQRPAEAGRTVPPQAQAAVALDLLRVRAEGNPADAVVHIPAGPEREYRCDAVIVGAGMGGVSAALEAARAGLTVCLTEPTRWVGGQMTSQGVSAFDDNPWIATTGATATYAELSRRIRASYYRQIPGSPTPPARDSLASFNPGRCWVSQLCFEPRRGLAVLQQMLDPYLRSGRIQLWLHTVPVRVDRAGRHINSVLAYDFGSREWLRLRGRYFVDASATGDLLALTGLPYRTGAESRAETGEPNAPVQADPNVVQSINYPFLLQRNTSVPMDESGAPPPGYAKFQSKFSFLVDYGHGKTITYKMFERVPGSPGSFWDYRRVVDAAQFEATWRRPERSGRPLPAGEARRQATSGSDQAKGGEPLAPGAFAGDIATINWDSNDYCDAHLLSGNPEQRAAGLQQAKRASLGFAWWLRHAAPRDDGHGRGFPNLTLLIGGMGSADGLAQQPYIRESRRIIPLRTIVEQDLAVKFRPGARGELYPDSVGIGEYPIDIHSCGGTDFTSQTKPYEIPLGALIARDADNLLAAALDIGATHITNGAYRLHPTLWAEGEAVGAVLAQAVHTGQSPAQIDASAAQIRRLQRTLVEQGHPIFWFDDVPLDSPVFAGAQLGAAWGWIAFDTQTLHFDAAALLPGREVGAGLRKSGLTAAVLPRLTAPEAPSWQELRALGLHGITNTGEIRKGAFAAWLVRAAAK